MNIYAKNGAKVICSNLTGGYEYDQNIAKKHLKIGETYTIEYTDVHEWFTNVYLQEFPNISFNSVFFEDLKEN